MFFFPLKLTWLNDPTFPEPVFPLPLLFDPTLLEPTLPHPLLLSPSFGAQFASPSLGGGGGT